MKNTEKDNISLLVETARLYYEHGFTQQEIAEKFGISRPGVSRLLQKAQDVGIVQIKVVDPKESGSRLEKNIGEKYGLKKVIVVPTHKNPATIKARLGKATVIFLDQINHEKMILGISWGTTMQEVARQLKKQPIKNSIVVQLNGGISRAEYDTHASEIAKSIGEKYEAVPYLLPLPAVVDRSDLKTAITSDRNINRTLQFAKEAKIAVFTIGSFSHDSVLVKADYFNKKEVDDLINQGAVGDICSRILNLDGEIASRGLDQRTIGIELNDLKAKEYAIAVAGGRDKLSAIQAGLRGKWFNCLITDEWIAEKLLEE